MPSTARKIDDQREAWSGLEGLKLQLLELPEATLCEPRVRVSWVLAEASELLTCIRQTRTRLELLAAGLSERKLTELGPAIGALRAAEAEILAARCPDADYAEALTSALDLRDELLAACHWNLRNREVASALVRITDSTDSAELAMDLRELMQLVREHVSDFENDQSFRSDQSIRQASALADELTATRDAPIPAELLDLRDRAFTHLCGVIEEIRSAGRYAFRGRPEARHLFASELQPRRWRSRLNSLVRSLGE